MWLANSNDVGRVLDEQKIKNIFILVVSAVINLLIADKQSQPPLQIQAMYHFNVHSTHFV